MKNTAEKAFWRDAAGALPNSIALAYATLGHLLGLYLLVQSSAAAFIAGIALTAHTLVIAGYLVHECAHMTLFRSRRVNAQTGEVLLWLLGAAYASFARVQHMHLRHHLDRADLSLFDYQAFLQRQPRWVGRLVVALEWAYIPAVELIMHGQVIFRPFFEERLHVHRRRVVAVLASRIAMFVVLFELSPWAVAGYALAYLILLQALFLGDAFAHTYDAFFIDDATQPVPGMDGIGPMTCSTPTPTCSLPGGRG
ncbi:MAG: fatty acid desaturase [Halioglobus sp.]